MDCLNIFCCNISRKTDIKCSPLHTITGKGHNPAQYYYPTGRKLSLEIKFLQIANSLNLNFAYYNIFRNLSTIVYIVYISKLGKQNRSIRSVSEKAILR